MYPNQETLRRIRDIYYKRYQLSIIATAAVYLMNGIEAYVDAHLKNFDVSEDLSLMLGKPAVSTDFPTPYLLTSQPSAGFTLIGLRHRLHESKRFCIFQHLPLIVNFQFSGEDCHHRIEVTFQ